MNTVKAKFMCHSIIPNSWNGKSVTVHMNAVYGENGENADYLTFEPENK